MAEIAKSDRTKKDADTQAGTSVVLADGTEIAIRKADSKELEAFLMGGMVREETEESAENAVQQMVARILAGQTAEEIFGGGEVLSLSKQFLDRPFTILDVSWYKSDFADGPPMFMVMNVVDSDGSPKNVSSGSAMPMAMVYAAQMRGVLSDRRVIATKRERATKSGFHPINLSLAD